MKIHPNQKDLAKKYEHKLIICPKCGKQGKLYYRIKGYDKFGNPKRYWCVRHGDTYHQIGKILPKEIIKQLEGENKPRQQNNII